MNAPGGFWKLQLLDFALFFFSSWFSLDSRGLVISETYSKETTKENQRNVLPSRKEVGNLVGPSRETRDGSPVYTHVAVQLTSD